MDCMTLCQQYVDAWNRHDVSAVMDALGGGTYQDPTTPGPIGGDAMRAYVRDLWAAFPDLGFEEGPMHSVGDRQIHLQWTMVGTNFGSMRGLPPTGKRVRVPGIDVIDLDASGITGVIGYFDSAAVPRQLGLDVIVQPGAIGPFGFGTSTGVYLPKPVDPGVVAITELHARDDESVQRVKDLSRQVVIEQLPVPGFLSFTGTTIGRRMRTVSTWDSLESMRAALNGGTHAHAMREMYTADIAEGGVTSVFERVRVGPWLRRCPECHRMNRMMQREGRCECGAALVALL